MPTYYVYLPERDIHMLVKYTHSFSRLGSTMQLLDYCFGWLPNICLFSIWRILWADILSAFQASLSLVLLNSCLKWGLIVWFSDDTQIKHGILQYVHKKVFSKIQELCVWYKFFLPEASKHLLHRSWLSMPDMSSISGCNFWKHP